MAWLIYAVLIIAPLITYPYSIDPFQIKTLLISITGFSCLGYWITKDWKGIASIPLYFFWCFISFGYCQYRWGNPAIETLLLLAYLGIFLYSRDYLNKETTIKVLLISLILTLWYNYSHTGYSFVNKNIYAGWLVLLIPLALANMLKANRVYSAILAGALLGFAIGSLIGIGCRSSMLGVAAGLAVFSLFKWGKWSWMPIVWFAVLFSLLAWFFFPHQVLDPVRSYFWQGVLDQIQAHPIIGTGIGSFRTYYPLYKLNIMQVFEGTGATHLLENAHNMYFQILTEIGIVGLGLFLFMIWKVFKNADKTDILNIALIAGVFGCLIDNFWNVAYFYSTTGLMFWMFIGLLSSDTQKEGA